MIKRILTVLTLTGYFILNAQVDDKKTLYISRTTKTQIPKDLVLFRDIVNDLQSLQGSKKANESQILRLQLVTGIANRIKKCLSAMKIAPSEISDDFFTMSDFSTIDKNINFYLKKTMPCSLFESDKYFKVIQKKLRGFGPWLPSWAGFKYFINEDTLIDINQYLFMVEKVGIDLFSNLPEKDKESKIKAILDNKDFALSNNVADREKIKNNFQKTAGIIIEQQRLESDADELKKYVAKLLEQVKNQGISKEEKDNLEKKIQDMNQKIVGLEKAQEAKKKEQEDKDKKEKEELELKQKQDEQKRKEDFEKEMPNLINSLLSLDNELSILSDISKGIIKADTNSGAKQDGSEKKKEEPKDNNNKDEPNKEPEIETIEALPDWKFLLARLQLNQWAFPKEFAQALIDLESWTRGQKFANPDLKLEYEKRKEQIKSFYNLRPTKLKKLESEQEKIKQSIITANKLEVPKLQERLTQIAKEIKHLEQFKENLSEVIDKVCQEKKKSGPQCPPPLTKQSNFAKPRKTGGTGKLSSLGKFKTMSDLNKETKP